MSMITEFAEKLRNKIYRKKEYHEDFYKKMGCTEHDKDLHKATQLAFDECMEIVNELSEEYKSNGWIPCSERLPKPHENCLITIKYPKWDAYIRTGYLREDGKWSLTFDDCKVIAWMPLPEPWKEEGGTK